MVQDEQEKWDIVIKPRSGLFRLDLEEVWLYRDLLVMYIRRDIVTFYKQICLQDTFTQHRRKLYTPLDAKIPFR